MASLYVIDLTYIAEHDAVETHLDSHRDFLTRQYEAGIFLASGPKEPRIGGVILATGDRLELEQVLSKDPFHTRGIATYEVT